MFFFMSNKTHTQHTASPSLPHVLTSNPFALLRFSFPPRWSLI
jgi:hypothetical protein